MTVNIRQGLLEHPEQREFHIRCVANQIRAGVERSPNSAALREALKIPGDRRLQTQLFKQGRMHQVGKSSNLLDGALRQMPAFSNLLGREMSLALRSRVQRVETYLQRAERLAQAVVQV